MSSTLIIDHEIANLCRALTDAEKAQLEANLQAEGCRDPLVTWGDVLLDGHNRREICHRLGLPYETVQAVGVKTRENALNWVIANQLGRRNLIPEDVAYLRGKRYEAEKATVDDHRDRFAAAQAKGVDAALVKRGLKEPDLSPQNGDQGGKTSPRLAKEFGVSKNTIERDARFAVAVDKISETLGKEVADLIRTGRSGLTKAGIVAFAKEDNMTMDRFNDLRFDQQQRREKARKERKKSAPKAPPLTTLKRNADELDTRPVERMRAFMNALIQIATTPVTAATLAGYAWPKTWRPQVDEALPAALAYLNSLEKEWPNGTPEDRDHSPDAA